jgi:hypothetical protein
MRVAIAEDSVLLREGLTRLLTEAGHEVAAVAGEAEGSCGPWPSTPGCGGRRRADAPHVHRRGTARRLGGPGPLAISTPDLSGGNTTYPQSLDDPNSSHHISIDSGGGDITVSQG